ncbi:MAG: glycosyltransferase WbuB [Calditrichaeota bacterium]|nr:MAG: glycosyltransferase WbuB [Calditrichota bacterium]
MKNIWIFNHYALTPQFPGGTRHYELAMRFAQAGYSVAIFASSVNYQHPTESILPKGQKYLIETPHPSFKFIWVSTPTYSGNNWKRLLNMLVYCYQCITISKRLVVTKVLQRPDVVIGSTIHPFTPLMAQYLAKKYNSRYFFEVRDLWPQTLIELGILKADSVISKLLWKIEALSLKNVCGVVCFSPATINYFIEHYGLQKSLLHYIPNGTNLEENPTGEENFNEIFDSRYFNVLFTGSMVPSNRVDVICEAAKLIKPDKNIRIILVGGGTEKKRLREKYKDVERLIWMDPVPKTQVKSLLKKADALLLIQGKVAYGSSNKLYDYLSVGKPILSSVWVKHNDVVSRINAGLSVTPENPEELARAITQISELSVEEREEMGRAAIKFVKEYHSWDVLASKFLEIIENT